MSIFRARFSSVSDTHLVPISLTRIVYIVTDFKFYSLDTRGISRVLDISAHSNLIRIQFYRISSLVLKRVFLAGEKLRYN